MTINKLTRLQGQLLLLFVLLILACGRPSTRTVQTRPAPESRPPARPVFQDTLPIIDDGQVNGPGTETTYPATRYATLPTRIKRVGNAIPAASNGCDFVGEIWDFANEGDCGLIVETNTGYLLSITGVPPGYYLEGGSRIRFGFNYDDIHPDECSLADGSVRITCLQLLRSSSGFPRPIICESHDRPSQWIHELIRDLGATYVTRLPWTDERTVYLFETPSGQYLYDCRGFILCQPPTNCLQYIDDFSLGVQIFVD